jgi:serine/threonine protein kinase
MTTCHLPFDANTIGELCQKISKASYTPPSVMNQNVPRELQNIIARCLKKNPADRYQTAGELLQDLNKAGAALSLPATRLATPAPVTAPSYSEPTSPAPRQVSATAEVVAKSKSPVPIIAAIAGVVLLVVVVSLYFLLKGDSNVTSAKPSQQSGVQPVPPQKQAAAQPVEWYTVDCAEGRAAVYSNGDRVGFTPHRFPAKSGEQFEFVLKLDGYQDRSVRVTTTENKKTYTFMMDRRQ